MKLQKFYYDEDGNDRPNWRTATRLDIVSPTITKGDETANEAAFLAVLRAAEKFAQTHSTVSEWIGPEEIQLENGKCEWSCTMIKG